MSEQIRDGTGSGKLAQVGNDHRLSVESKSRPEEEVEAQLENAFTLHGECHTAADTDGGLMYFKNTSTTREVVVTRIFIDAHTITPTDLIVTQIKSPETVTSGTDISTTGIVQKNFGSGIMLTGTLVISDGSADMTFTGGTKYHAVPIQTMTPQVLETKGTNIITPNTTVLWGWKTVSGDNATDGEIVSLSVNCFARDIV